MFCLWKKNQKAKWIHQDGILLQLENVLRILLTGGGSSWVSSHTYCEIFTNPGFLINILSIAGLAVPHSTNYCISTDLSPLWLWVKTWHVRNYSCASIPVTSVEHIFLCSNSEVRMLCFWKPMLVLRSSLHLLHYLLHFVKTLLPFLSPSFLHLSHKRRD